MATATNEFPEPFAGAQALLDLVLFRLSAWGNTHQAASGWISAHCPAHDDRCRSLSLRAGDARIVFRCHAGCTPQDVVAPLGLTLADLAYGSHQACEHLHGWQPDAATQARAAV